ncbi:hypothetical protein F4811DRAFT_335692 [Daldinia bambusicola]|nr:hypothetical protein F4811DRAFT_335692 [Daldinia bambusicola]
MLINSTLLCTITVTIGLGYRVMGLSIFTIFLENGGLTPLFAPWDAVTPGYNTTCLAGHYPPIVCVTRSLPKPRHLAMDKQICVGRQLVVP